MTKWVPEAAPEMLTLEAAAHSVRVALLEPGFHATRMIDDAVRGAWADPMFPCADAERRIVAWFAGARQTAAHPDHIAQAVYHAITTDRPRLRYLDGADAEVYVGGRARMPKDWADLGQPMSGEAFFAASAAGFPAPAVA